MMSNTVKTLHEIIEFCKHQELANFRDTPCTRQTESDLYNWIEASSRVIVETVIPEKFWQFPLDESSSPIVSFSQIPTNPKECVLMLMLWSCWTDECHQEIVKCLEYGANVLKSHHLEWVCQFSYCIALNLDYSAFILPIVTELRSAGHLFVESICLRQVVYYSSCLHQLFDNFESVRDIVVSFKKELPSCKLLPTVPQKPPDVYLLTKNGKDRFTLVSIVEWFKRSYIIPQLQNMLNLKQIKSLAKAIKREMIKEDVTPDVFFDAIDIHAKKAAHILGITHPSRSARLVTFVMNATQFTTRMERTPTSDEKDMLLLKSYVENLCHDDSNRNAAYELKRIIQKDYLFSDNLIADFINKKFDLGDKDWCWYLKFTKNQGKMRLEDNTQEAQVTTVNTKTKKNMKKSPLKRKLNPLTSNIHTHSFDQNKKPRSSLKAKISPKTSSSQKHVTFSKATL
jgi:hypothetical protein